MTYDDAYKQWLIDQITSGHYDYTYGPGSPGATPSDMRQTTGARDNTLQTGDIALPPRDYALFTPMEREQYHIADTSFISPGNPRPAGKIERYFGPEVSGTPIPSQYTNTPSYLQQPPTPDITPQATRQGNYAGMSTWQDYLNPRPSPTQQIGSSIGTALGNLGHSIVQSSQQSTNQALAMLRNPAPQLDPLTAAYLQQYQGGYY